MEKMYADSHWYLSVEKLGAVYGKQYELNRGWREGDGGHNIVKFMLFASIVGMKLKRINC